VKYVLIRDDDLNYHSDFAQIEAVHGKLIERGIPVNFATIAAVNTAARTESPDFGEGTYEPFLPRELAGTDREWPIDQNRRLVERLNDWPGVEILQHGYDHCGRPGHYEFESEDAGVIGRKLSEAREILRRAFGRRPDTFVAPQDQYSSEALRQIRAQFRMFSLGWIDRRKLPVAYLPAYAAMKLRGRHYLRMGRCWMLEHPGCLFSRFRDPVQGVAKLKAHLAAHRVTIVVVHHWEFFDAQGKPLAAHVRAFVDTMLALHAQPDVRFLRFSELPPVLAGRA